MRTQEDHPVKIPCPRPSQRGVKRGFAPLVRFWRELKRWFGFCMLGTAIAFSGFPSIFQYPNPQLCAIIPSTFFMKGDTMQPYTSFAQVYDTFMDNVPYEDWSARIQSILKQYDITSGLALDLGCGTGKMTELLATAGYDMIGVDNSEDMLELAMEKRLKSGHDILYLLQNMQEFELYGTVGAIVSVCDSVNYMVEEEELLEVFRLANNYLDPEGIFLFDFNTEYK